jgi:glycosyltransferase involved in cell wall biosynthesis
LLQRESIDVVYDRTFHMTLIAGPAAGRCGVPRVSTIVSPPELALPMVESRFIWLKRKRLARYYRRSHRVIAVSQQAAESAERYYRLPGGSVEVIRNPVDRQQIEQSASQFAPQRDKRLTLACVGRMTDEKGHHDLIAAVAMAQTNWPTELPPLCVWLIGDGPRRGELESQWRAINRGLHRIEFLGKQTNPAPYIKMADALVLPSHFEGMPNVVLEAMALGTPVIATRVGGTIELQRDQPTIYWSQPQQAESLTRAILEFAKDRQAAQQRVQAASQMIADYHDVTACVARIQTRLLQACSSSEHDYPSDAISSNFSQQAR